MPKYARAIAFLLAILVATTGRYAHAATKAELDTQLSAYVSDLALRDFLATEATAAGVSEFHFVGSAELQRKCPGGDYGCSTFKSGSRRGDVYLNVEVAGGTGVTNRPGPATAILPDSSNLLGALEVIRISINPDKA